MYNIISVLYYYFNDKNCFIQKILLITKRNDINWYNDITNFKKKPLIYLFIKLKDESATGKTISSHILDSELNNICLLEIHTLNLYNSEPTLLSKNEILKLMFDEWINQT